jgi:hypothetical protein
MARQARSAVRIGFANIIEQTSATGHKRSKPKPIERIPDVAKAAAARGCGQ